MEFGDSFAELLDKFIVLHIRCWKLEDYIAEAQTDRRIADAKRKLDYCFKDRRPKLTKAINSFLDVYISKNHARIFSVENTKVYEGFDNKICNHIIGIGDGADEWWYTYKDDDKGKKSYIEKGFNYCPECGEKIKEET